MKRSASTGEAAPVIGKVAPVVASEAKQSPAAGDGGGRLLRFARNDRGAWLVLLFPSAAALLWAIPFAWMALASLRQGSAGSADIASLLPAPPFSLENFSDAWTSGHFPLWYGNTILLCGGILAVQCVTVSLAGYAFARLRFPGKEFLFYAFLLQLMLVPPILIVPNMSTLVSLG
jgi:sn-glycerol 3-phosphate transport system permease protein